ncbi:MAG: hypothetical protein AAF975_07545, partial [Spirochaetota bacterium]
IFFLFFIGKDRLVLRTQEPWRWPFQRTVEGFRRAAQAQSGSKSIFGDYANDGGQREHGDEDDGVTIEDYLNQSGGPQNHPNAGKGFDWNWQHHPEGVPPIRPENRGERLEKYFREHWHAAWSRAFPGKEQQFLSLFWVAALLWIPLTYGALDGVNLWQAGGFIRYGEPAWANFYVFLGLANFSLPVLANHVARKLWYSLSDSKLDFALGLMPELAYSLAYLCFFYLLAGHVGWAIIGLLAAELFLRLSLLRNMSHALPLFLFRQFSCLGISLGLYLYLVL